LQGKRRAHTLLRGNRLYVEFVGQVFAAPLWPDASGRWAFDESAPGLTMSFDRDVVGEVTKMRLWNDNKEAGTFQKIRPANDWPTVEQLMAFRREKQGGDRLDALRTLEMKGKLRVGLAQLDVSFLAAGPEQLLRRVTTRAGTEIVIVDRGRAWRQPAGQPVEELTGQLREQTERISPLARIGDWRRPNREIQIVGKDQVGKEDAWVVRLSGAFQPPTTRYVSTTSGLLLKEDAWITAKGVGTVPHAILYEDYRDVDGVPLPFRYINDSALTGHQVVQLTEAKANPEVPAGTFSSGKPGK